METEEQIQEPEMLYTCSWCGERKPEGDMYNINTTMSSRNICLDCDGNTFICDNCGDRYSNDDYEADGQCRSCWNGDDRDDDGYFEGQCMPKLKFLPTNVPKDTEKYLYMGVEMEVDNFDTRSSCGQELTALDPKKEFFWQTDDGSLRNGIEIISHPCTLTYHKEVFPWKDIVKIVNKHGGTAHDAETCGLHIHFNSGFLGKPQSEEHNLNTFKLISMYHQFWGNMVIFSRRTNSQLRWCGQYPIHYSKNYKAELARMPEAKRMASKSIAVNLNDCDRTGHIEIRLNRGTTRLDSLYASLEFLDYQLRFIKENTFLKLNHTKWEKFVNNTPFDLYPNLYPYLKRRKLIGVAKDLPPLPKEEVNARAKLLIAEAAKNGRTMSNIAARRNARILLRREGRTGIVASTTPPTPISTPAPDSHEEESLASQHVDRTRDLLGRSTIPWSEAIRRVRAGIPLPEVQGVTR